MRRQVRNGIDPLKQKQRNRETLLIQQWLTLLINKYIILRFPLMRYLFNGKKI